MAVTPRRSATARIDSPARPSVSATAMAAATMASTLSPGLGPGPVRGPGVRHSRAMDRAGSPCPPKMATSYLLMAYIIYWFTAYRIAHRSARGGGRSHARGKAARREHHRGPGPRRGSGAAAAGEPPADRGPAGRRATPLGQRPGAGPLADRRPQGRVPGG